ncbi:MAG: fasciclin domain-containing protein [Bacteroidales bacterium]|nr:fasciclin domain-containing protein [Bacteroidales bacterium]
MKRKIFGKAGSASIIMILAAAFLFTFTSCEKAEFAPMGGPDSAKMKNPAAAPVKSEKSIAAIAIDAGFSELVEALVYVDANVEPSPGLVNLFLNGKDQFTVFAPTNAAFENLYLILGITDITDLPAPLVLNVLLYHVTEGRRAANSVVPKVGTRTIETLLGTTFKVDKTAKIWAVGNTAKIVSPNISASNGIIHVIDAVILPIVP